MHDVILGHNNSLDFSVLKVLTMQTFENFYLFAYQKCAPKEPTFLLSTFKLLLNRIFNHKITCSSGCLMGNEKYFKKFKILYETMQM
jgi:hypothetical protein